MTMYDIIKKNGDAARVLNALLKCAVRCAQAGDYEVMFAYLSQWDGAVMMHNEVVGYSDNLHLDFEEDIKIQTYVKRILYRH